ncbi:alpha/beta hydrolase [Mycolicibacterium arenosum]|uniref:Alpha/beta hydrolase family protein n=1 Tax=Mycolicibacterium arenosum TaxID=2952157 RepID=A0ABT1MA68_9MYCO|nr:alpha/beta hydrolase [Mycolicibacterium sp. CAU 1645]MCP9276056.1 alpha/beta hydrolase family protein [Mycolicibacterium sp. CAU 1645]
MSRPTVAQAAAWRVADLRLAADRWEADARAVHARAEAARSVPIAAWTGQAADAARRRMDALRGNADDIATALVLAAAAARDAADQLGAAQDGVTALVETARSEGYSVDDGGGVHSAAPPTELLTLLAGGDPDVARDLQRARAAELTRQLAAALERLGVADADAARDVDEAFAAGLPATAPAPTSPAAAAAPTGEDWDVRVAENRLRVAREVLDVAAGTPRADLYRALLAEIDDPSGSGARIDRQILDFDPARNVLVELNGDLRRADHVAVLVPGMNTTLDGSAATTGTARSFVTASGGDVAAITYLGGPFPQSDVLPLAVLEASDPRYALAMAPRLAAFSHDLDRVVDGTGRPVDVTYIGHSYGGAILGTAEVVGLTADRTLYVAAAGAGVGVDEPSDWHNGNPSVSRYSLTAPGDPIALVQQLAVHGVDPDEMPGVQRLEAGRYDDGRPVEGLAAHSDVLAVPTSDAWRTVLAVISGAR